MAYAPKLLLIYAMLGPLYVHDGSDGAPCMYIMTPMGPLHVHDGFDGALKVNNGSNGTGAMVAVLMAYAPKLFLIYATLMTIDILGALSSTF
jgi:hypothetical protein